LTLFKEIKEYIERGEQFNKDLALEISKYQLKNNPFYREYAEKLGVKGIKRFEEIPFLPVEFFKNFKIFSFKKADGFFLSSGTSGNQSKVYYNNKTLEIYEISALKSFPFKKKKIYSLIPPFSIAKNSSLAFMIDIFSKNLKLTYSNRESFEIKPKKFLEIIERKVEDGSVLFLTSLQLYKMAQQRNHRIEKELIIIETGGYKATNKNYRRKQLYRFAKKVFPQADFFSEYGMAELFSQFYTTGKNKNYNFHHYNYIISKNKKDILRVFDFANLGTVSALLVPDLIFKEENEFDVKGRLTSEIRGCGYVFK